MPDEEPRRADDEPGPDAGTGFGAPVMPLPASRRRLLVQIWALLTLGLLVRAFAAGLIQERQAGPGPWSPLRIDLNRASVAELCALPGIGPERAEAIVLHRLRHGWFATVDELGQVDGIGPHTLAQVRVHAVAMPPPR